jgi:hypothetical protein
LGDTQYLLALTCAAIIAAGNAIAVNAEQAPPYELIPKAVPAAPTAPTPNSPTAALAAESAKRFAEADPLLTSLDSLTAPEWNAMPLRIYVETGRDYGTIDGDSMPLPKSGSEAVLREFGCTHALVKKFSRTQRSVYAAIYTFYSPEGAYGAYSCMREGASTVVVRGAASSENDDSVSFWKGRRFVVVKGQSDDDEVSKALVGRLADRLAQLIQSDSAVPAMVSKLPYLYRLTGSEKLFMGPLAARRFGNVPDVQDLQIEKSRGAAFADYLFPPPAAERLRAMVVDFGNPALAQNVYANYSATVSDGRKTQALDSFSLMFKLNNSYLMCALRGNRVVVVSGARRKDSAALLSRQLAY